MKDTLHECLLVDSDHMVMYDENWRYAGGEWIDDGQILNKKWEPGMRVRAINYCLDKRDRFRSLQLMVGDS